MTFSGLRHNAFAIIATFAVLAGLGIFAWRVTHYVTLIQTGSVDLATLSFLSTYTPLVQTGNTPLPEGDFETATEDDPSIGPEDARVTIVEFADFGCPYSRAESFVIRALARAYRDDVRYIYRDFPIDELHPNATLAAEAGECAQEQGKFWEFHDKVYLAQGSLTESMLVETARAVNMDTSAFTQCLRSGRYEQEVQEDIAAGFAAGVRGTPTFFLNGNRVPGAIPEDVFTDLIQRLLAS